MSSNYTDIPIQSIATDALATSAGVFVPTGSYVPTGGITDDTFTSGDHYHLKWEGTPVVAVQLLNTRIPVVGQIHHSNNTFEFSIDATPYVITLSNGWYNLTKMVQALTTGMVNLGLTNYSFVANSSASVLNGKYTSVSREPRLRMLVKAGCTDALFSIPLSNKASVIPFVSSNANNHILGVDATGNVEIDIATPALFGKDMLFNIGFPRYSWIINSENNYIVGENANERHEFYMPVGYYDNVPKLLTALNTSTNMTFTLEESKVIVRGTVSSNSLIFTDGIIEEVELPLDEFGNQIYIWPDELVITSDIPEMLGSAMFSTNPVGQPDISMRVFMRSEWLSSNTDSEGLIILAQQNQYSEDDDLNVPAGIPIIPGKMMHRSDEPMSTSAIHTLYRPKTNFVMDLTVGRLSLKLNQSSINYNQDGFTGILRLYH